MSCPQTTCLIDRSAAALSTRTFKEICETRVIENKEESSCCHAKSKLFAYLSTESSSVLEIELGHHARNISDSLNLNRTLKAFKNNEVTMYIVHSLINQKNIQEAQI